MLLDIKSIVAFENVPFAIVDIGVHFVSELIPYKADSLHLWSLSLWSDGERLCKYELQH